MNRRNFSQLLALTGTTVLTGSAIAAANTAKPNLLFILTDEHSFRTLGCYRKLLSKDQAEMWGPGNVVETPHIDSIAENGTLFNRMYASAPVCTPARASMFTGLYGHQLGMPNNSTKPGDGKYLHADVPTIAEVLRDAGYMTGYCGKWHLAESTGDNHEEFWQPHPVGKQGHNYGFIDNTFMENGGHEKFRGIDKTGSPYKASNRPEQYKTNESGQPVYKDARSGNVKYTTDWLADRTIDFIGRNKDKPFYYVCSIPDPHTPDLAREPYLSMYKNMKFERPRTYDAPRPEGTPKWQMPDGKAEKMLESIPHYFGMVKCIDDNVGRILKKLEDEGILENTLVVFTADHGDLYGEHARMNKGTIHETSARVPFVICHGRTLKNPLVPRGKIINQAANTTDWMPTFLSLLKQPCPKVEGRDLTPLLADQPPADWNDVTFSTLWFVAAIDARHKLVLMPKEKPWLLDIEADPDELKNYFGDPAYASVTQKLAADLKGFTQRCDAGSHDIPDQLEKMLNG